jgi:hypothetical protein
MKLITLLFLASALASLAAETVLQEVQWSQLAKDGKLPSGTVVSATGEPEALKIENREAKPLTAPVLAFDQPKITTDFYRVQGEVRYEGVEGNGFLEMWNHFPGGGAYFSRTMGQGGPMGMLQGTSGWRGFILPFNATGANGHPLKLEINLRLPGKGTVYLRNVKLLQMSSFGATQPGAWWSDRTAGWIGGVIGLFLGTLGSYMEWSASRGRSRRFVLAAARALIALGIVITIVGLIAISLRQPYGVWYVLLLAGILCALIFPFRLRRYEAQYRAVELRRMAALDAA